MKTMQQMTSVHFLKKHMVWTESIQNTQQKIIPKIFQYKYLHMWGFARIFIFEHFHSLPCSKYKIEGILLELYAINRLNVENNHEVEGK